MQIVSTAWNVKSCFLGNEKKKKKKKKKKEKFNLSSAEALGLYNASLLLVK